MSNLLRSLFRFIQSSRSVTNYPDFWIHYKATFDHKLPQDLTQVPFVVFDTETTGLSTTDDRILSIGAIPLKNKALLVSESFEVYVDQHFYHAENIEVHGILQIETAPKLTELEALQFFLHFIGNAVLVAHHAGFDRAMINAALRRHGLPKLKNAFLDTSALYKRTLISTVLLEKKERYSLDDLADKFDIPKKDRHTALGDAYITAIAFLNIIEKLKGAGSMSLRQLLR